MALFIPFDNNPVNNDETAASYTVPAGFYAIVSVTLSASAYVYPTTSNVGSLLSDTSEFTASNTADSVNLTLRLKSGEVLTLLETVASGSSIGSGTSVGTHYVSGTSIASVSINSVVVGKVIAPASGGIRDIIATANRDIGVALAGSAEVNWSVAEYNNIS